MIGSRGAERSVAAFTRIMLGFLLVYTTWAWAGLRPSFHEAGVAASGILLVGLAIGGRSAAWRVLRRDPVFFLGLAFLGYLVLQWINAGRTQYFDVGYQRWAYTDPPWPGWPSAFSRADAAQMLAWFFPAWTIAVAIRLRVLDRHALRRLLMFVACNAGLLAVFGLVQYASGTKAIYWIQPLGGHFFASFAYGNHAGPYFVLVGGLAAGLLYREVFDTRSSHADSPSVLRLRHPWRVAILVPVMMLCLVGANMGFSRAGVILAGLLGLFAVGYGWVRGWRRLQPAGRVNLFALSLAVLGGLFFIVGGFGEEGIRKEFTLRPAAPETVHTVWDRVALELGDRARFARAAVDIWREHPWLGVGGWGYKYLVASHVPEEFWPVLDKRGWANVHVDLLQFLAEFGVAGTGLLLAALGVMLREALDPRRCRRDAFWSMGMASLGLTLWFSCIDIPFRCPAILYAWVALLAAIPVICQIHPADDSAAKAASKPGESPGRTKP